MIRTLKIWYQRIMDALVPGECGHIFIRRISGKLHLIIDGNPYAVDKDNLVTLQFAIERHHSACWSRRLPCNNA